MDGDAEELDQLRAEDVAEELGVLSPRLVRARPELARRLRSGTIGRHGSCVVLHNGPLTALQRQWVGVLSGGPAAALARSTALIAAGMTGVRTRDLVVVVPWTRTPAAVEGVRYVRTRHLRGVDVLAGSLPRRTTVPRSVVEEASRSSRDAARTLIAMAVQQRKATPAQVREVLARLGPVRQAVLLELTLADVEGGSHSLPELLFLEVLRAAGLPTPVRQVVRLRPDGRYYLDAAWPGLGLVVEVDGSHHRDASNWEADVLRQDELVVGGLVVVRVLSWWVRERPALVADLVRRALLSRGWRP